MGIRQGPGVLKDPKVLLCDFFDGFVWRLNSYSFSCQELYFLLILAKNVTNPTHFVQKQAPYCIVLYLGDSSTRGPPLISPQGRALDWPPRGAPAGWSRSWVPRSSLPSHTTHYWWLHCTHTHSTLPHLQSTITHFTQALERNWTSQRNWIHHRRWACMTPPLTRVYVGHVYPECARIFVSPPCHLWP